MSRNLSILLIMLAILVISGCAKNLKDQGYATSFSEIAALEGTATTKDQVKKLMGSPSTISNYGDETWYYIKAKTENVAFFKSNPVEREILSVSFNAEGNIKDVEVYTLKDGRKIDFAKDETPSEGNSMGVAEQLIGNLGRFNPGQK